MSRSSTASTFPLFGNARAAVAGMGARTWQQLLLLGFNEEKYRRQEGVAEPRALGPAMFATASPNVPGIACVLHFLLPLVAPETKSRLDAVFPTYDPAGKREFRTVVQGILKDLAAKNVLPKECGLRAGSVLNVPQGHRADALVAQVASCAIVAVLKRDHPRGTFRLQPTANDELGIGAASSCARSEYVSVIRAMQVRCLREADRFRRRSAQILSMQEHWMSTADELSREYEEAVEDLRHASSVVRRGPGMPSSEERAFVNQSQATVAAGWEDVDSFFENDDTKKTDAAVRSFLDRKVHPASHRLEVAPLRTAMASSNISARLSQAALGDAPTTVGGGGGGGGADGEADGSGNSRSATINLWAVVEGFNRCLADVVRRISPPESRSPGTARSPSPPRRGAAPPSRVPGHRPFARLAEELPRLKQAVLEQGQNVANVRALNTKLRACIKEMEHSVAQMRAVGLQRMSQSGMLGGGVGVGSGSSHSGAPGAAVVATPSKPAAKAELSAATPAFTYMPRHFDDPAALAAYVTPIVQERHRSALSSYRPSSARRPAGAALLAAVPETQLTEPQAAPSVAAHHSSAAVTSAPVSRNASFAGGGPLQKGKTSIEDFAVQFSASGASAVDGSILPAGLEIPVFKPKRKAVRPPALPRTSASGGSHQSQSVVSDRPARLERTLDFTADHSAPASPTPSVLSEAPRDSRAPMPTTPPNLVRLSSRQAQGVGGVGRSRAPRSGEPLNGYSHAGGVGRPDGSQPVARLHHTLSAVAVSPGRNRSPGRLSVHSTPTRASSQRGGSAGSEPVRVIPRLTPTRSPHGSKVTHTPSRGARR